VLLIDARPGERQLDLGRGDSAAPKAARRALLIRPAENLTEGRRYVRAPCATCARRRQAIKPSFAFRSMRDKARRDQVDRGTAAQHEAGVQGLEAREGRSGGR
jgi:hypothetical protein